MQDILTCAMGLDVHRDVIVACLAKGELGTDPEIEIRSFSTLIPEMRKLRDWVIETGCHHIAMESTGIYWQGSKAGNNCFGSQAAGTNLHDAEDGNPIQRRVL